MFIAFVTLIKCMLNFFPAHFQVKDLYSGILLLIFCIVQERHAKLVSTLIAFTPKLSLTTVQPLSEAKPYRQLVGSLQYLAFTRSDVSYKVNRLSQYKHQTTEKPVSTRKYITDLLHHTRMTHTKPVSTPMASTPKLTLTTVQPLISPNCGMSTIPCIHQI